MTEEEEGHPQFSFNLYGTPTAELVALAVHGETCGFEGVWLGDHVVAPRAIDSRYPYATTAVANPMDGTNLNDVWVSVGAMLAATRRLVVGTGVYVVPLRNPFVTALAAATAQNLSGGRFVLGVGSGWLREEFGLLEQEFEGRGGRMDEIVEIMRKLWRGGFQSHQGRWYRFSEVRAEAARPPVPIVVGGSSEPAMRRAATLGDGWYASSDVDLDAACTIRERIESLRGEAGRDELPFEYHVRLGNDALDPDSVRRYVDRGFGRLTIGTNGLWRGATSLQERIDWLDRLRERLLEPATT